MLVAVTDRHSVNVGSIRALVNFKQIFASVIVYRLVFIMNIHVFVVFGNRIDIAKNMSDACEINEKNSEINGNVRVRECLIIKMYL